MLDRTRFCLAAAVLFRGARCVVRSAVFIRFGAGPTAQECRSGQLRCCHCAQCRCAAIHRQPSRCSCNSARRPRTVQFNSLNETLSDVLLDGKPVKSVNSNDEQQLTTVTLDEAGNRHCTH